MKIQFALRSTGVSLVFIFIVACSPPQAETAQGTEACRSCGVVQSVSPVTQEGSPTGTGAVIGAIVGGVAGNQVGGGTGNKIATAAGVIGGAVVGNNIEQNRNASTWYEVVIAMEDGGEQLITVQDPGGISPGAAVNVYQGNISLR